MKNQNNISNLMQQSQVGFGTSGARGLVSKMTDYVCYSYTRAFIDYMIDSKQIDPQVNNSIVVAGDLRQSSPQIMNACAKAIIDSGLKVINAGFIAAPAVALYGFKHAIASIMVTGSHIPDDRNGIKFNSPKGEILKKDELGIKEQLVHDSVHESKELFSHSENFSVATNYLPNINKDIEVYYLQRYQSFFPAQALKGMNIGIYQHSGVARDSLVAIVEYLGAKASPLNRSEQFIPVDTEAIREEDSKLAKQWVEEYQFDAIISTDGDADRPLISDEKGQWFRGDIVGILCAQYCGIKHIVTPVSSNTAVEKSHLFGSVSRTQIGSPYVIAQMEQLIKQGKTHIAGYEANGGFLLADDISVFHSNAESELKSLPTRDALIVLLALLHQSKIKQVPLSQLSQDLPQRFTYSERIKQVPTELSQQLISGYADRISGKEKIIADFSDVFDSPVKIETVDQTDGLRINFDNNQIIHFRPSGNAPELRCYTEADSENEAKRVNQFCLNKIKLIIEKQLDEDSYMSEDKDNKETTNEHQSSKKTDWQEEILVTGGELVDKVKKLIAEGNVRKIIIRKPNGDSLIEVPLSTGVAVSGILTLMAPVLAAIGAMAALVKNFKVEVIRVDDENKD